MMDHEPSRPVSPSRESTPSKADSTKAASSKSASTKPTPSTGLRETFSRQRFVAFADRVGLTRIAQVPGIGWVVGIAALALLIQGVGLANLVAVNEDKQKWEAASGQRQGLLDTISELEQEKISIKTELHTLKGKIDLESGRLAEVQAALKLTNDLRDQAQREQGAASNEANRLRESNETIATQTKDLSARHVTTTTIVSQLETDRQRLAAEVATSKQLLEENRTEVERAQQHASDLDKKAAATLEAIRLSREAQIKAQQQLDDAVKLVAKAEADGEASKVRLATIESDIASTVASLEDLHKQQTSLKTSLASEKKLTVEAVGARMAMEAELVVIREKLEKAAKILAQKQGAAAGEESLIAAAQTRSDAIKSRIANMQAELKPLEEQRLDLEADVAGKRKELEILRQRIDSARTDLSALPLPVPSTPPVAAPMPSPSAPAIPAAPEKPQDKKQNTNSAEKPGDEKPSDAKPVEEKKKPDAPVEEPSDAPSPEKGDSQE